MNKEEIQSELFHAAKRLGVFEGISHDGCDKMSLIVTHSSDSPVSDYETWRIGWCIKAYNDGKEISEDVRIIDKLAIAAGIRVSPNAAMCPECGGELIDSNPNLVLTSNPPKKDVKCTKCEYKGYRELRV